MATSAEASSMPIVANHSEGSSNNPFRFLTKAGRSKSKNNLKASASAESETATMPATPAFSETTSAKGSGSLHSPVSSTMTFSSESLSPNTIFTTRSGSTSMTTPPTTTSTSTSPKINDPSVRYSLAMLDHQWAAMELLVLSGQGAGLNNNLGSSTQTNMSMNALSDPDSAIASEFSHNAGSVPAGSSSIAADKYGLLRGASHGTGPQISLKDSEEEEPHDIFGKNMLWDALGLEPENSVDGSHEDDTLTTSAKTRQIVSVPPHAIRRSGTGHSLPALPSQSSSSRSGAKAFREQYSSDDNDDEDEDDNGEDNDATDDSDLETSTSDSFAHDLEVELRQVGVGAQVYRPSSIILNHGLSHGFANKDRSSTMMSFPAPPALPLSLPAPALPALTTSTPSGSTTVYRESSDDEKLLRNKEEDQKEHLLEAGIFLSTTSSSSPFGQMSIEQTKFQPRPVAKDTEEELAAKAKVEQLRETGFGGMGGFSTDGKQVQGLGLFNDVDTRKFVHSTEEVDGSQQSLRGFTEQDSINEDVDQGVDLSALLTEVEAVANSLADFGTIGASVKEPPPPPSVHSHASKEVAAKSRNLPPIVPSKAEVAPWREYKTPDLSASSPLPSPPIVPMFYSTGGIGNTRPPLRAKKSSNTLTKPRPNATSQLSSSPSGTSFFSSLTGTGKDGDVIDERIGKSLTKRLSFSNLRKRKSESALSSAMNRDSSSVMATPTKELSSATVQLEAKPKRRLSIYIPHFGNGTSRKENDQSGMPPPVPVIPFSFLRSKAAESDLQPYNSIIYPERRMLPRSPASAPPTRSSFFPTVSTSPLSLNSSGGTHSGVTHSTPSLLGEYHPEESSLSTQTTSTFFNYGPDVQCVPEKSVTGIIAVSPSESLMSPPTSTETYFSFAKDDSAPPSRRSMTRQASAVTIEDGSYRNVGGALQESVVDTSDKHLSLNAFLESDQAITSPGSFILTFGGLEGKSKKTDAVDRPTRTSSIFPTVSRQNSGAPVLSDILNTTSRPLTPPLSGHKACMLQTKRNEILQPKFFAAPSTLTVLPVTLPSPPVSANQLSSEGSGGYSAGPLENYFRPSPTSELNRPCSPDFATLRRSMSGDQESGNSNASSNFKGGSHTTANTTMDIFGLVDRTYMESDGEEDAEDNYGRNSDDIESDRSEEEDDDDDESNSSEGDTKDSDDETPLGAIARASKEREDETPLGIHPGALTAQKSLRQNVKNTLPKRSKASGTLSASRDPFELDRDLSMSRKAVVKEGKRLSSARGTQILVAPNTKNQGAKTEKSTSSLEASIEIIGHSLLPHTDDAVVRRSQSLGLVKSPSLPLNPVIANSTLAFDSSPPPATKSKAASRPVPPRSSPLLNQMERKKPPGLMIQTSAQHMEESSKNSAMLSLPPGLAPSPSGSTSSSSAESRSPPLPIQQRDKVQPADSPNVLMPPVARSPRVDSFPKDLVISPNARSAQAPAVLALSASTNSRMQAGGAAGSNMDRRIFIQDQSRHITVNTNPQMLCGDIVKIAKDRGALTGGSDNEGGFALWDLCRALGVERPIREYELLSDVVKSWDGDSNILVIRRTTLWPIISTSLRPQPQNARGDYVQLEVKRGKWSKRYLRLKDETLSQGRSDRSKDMSILCNLSCFEVFFVNPQVVDQIKAPRPFVLALKSTLPRAHFEEVSEYCHFFSVKTADELQAWVKAITEARNGLLRQREQAFMAANGLPSVTSPALGGSGLKPLGSSQVKAGVSTPNQGPGPLIKHIPGRPAPQILATSAGSALTSRRAPTVDSKGIFSGSGGTQPHSSVGAGSSMVSPSSGGEAGGKLSGRPSAYEWSGMNESERQKWLKSAERDARSGGQAFLSFNSDDANASEELISTPAPDITFKAGLKPTKTIVRDSSRR